MERRDHSPIPRALWVLMGINVAVFVAWHRLPIDAVGPHLVVSVDGLRAGRIWTLLTAAFSHYDASHLVFNLLGLHVFGGGIAGLVRSRDLVQLYVVGALCASLGHVAYGLITGSAAPALGASGAVMALGVVFAALRPGAVLLLFFVIPLRAPLAVGLFVLLDLSGVLGGPSTDGVAHAAHLGGALYGLLWWWLSRRPSTGARGTAR